MSGDRGLHTSLIWFYFNPICSFLPALAGPAQLRHPGGHARPPGAAGHLCAAGEHRAHHQHAGEWGGGWGGFPGKNVVKKA